MSRLPSPFASKIQAPDATCSTKYRIPHAPFDCLNARPACSVTSENETDDMDSVAGRLAAGGVLGCSGAGGGATLRLPVHPGNRVPVRITINAHSLRSVRNAVFRGVRELKAPLSSQP